MMDCDFALKAVSWHKPFLPQVGNGHSLYNSSENPRTLSDLELPFPPHFLFLFFFCFIFSYNLICVAQLLLEIDPTVECCGLIKCHVIYKTKPNSFQEAFKYQQPLS